MSVFVDWKYIKNQYSRELLNAFFYGIWQLTAAFHENSVQQIFP